MNSGLQFKKFHKKLVWESILQSALCGMVWGFAVDFVIALVSWITGFNDGYWIAICALFGVALLCGTAYYFAKFRPDGATVARRMDAMGLAERAVTVRDFANDDSFMAEYQRRDADKYLAAANRKKFTLRISKTILCVFLVVAIIGIAMTTVSALAANGVLPNGGDIVDSITEYDVTYMVDEGGEIVGETDQIVVKGENATPVMALPDEGWFFVCWDDGVAEPYREDLNISEDLFVTAIFEEIEEGMDDDVDFDGEDIDAGDMPSDQPHSGSGGTAEGGEGNGDGGTGDGTGTGSGGDEGDGKGQGAGSGAGGTYSPSNQVIDGETYYRNVLEEYRQKVMEYLSSDNELTPEEREFIEKYFGGL